MKLELSRNMVIGLPERKPILVVGSILFLVLWLGQQLDEIGLNFIVGLGIILFFFAKVPKRKSVSPSEQNFPLDFRSLSEKIEKIALKIDTLSKEIQEGENRGGGNEKIRIHKVFESQLQEIKNFLQRDYINVGILKANLTTNITDLAEKLKERLGKGIEIQVIEEYEGNEATVKQCENQDLLLVVFGEDLMASQKDLVRLLKEKWHNIIILFDDVNYFLPAEKVLVLESIKNSLANIVDNTEIITVSSREKITKVRRYLDETRYEEWEEKSVTNYQKLYESITLIINNKHHREKLILATAYRQAVSLENEVATELNAIRRRKALRVIEKYQILAATTTFANPVASLDLLAAAAINSQMIMDLAKIYQQPLSLSQARQIAVRVVDLMLKLGIVEFSSQLITHILKTNIATLVATGIIQGVSAAYLTRVCGLTIVEYYQNNSETNSQEFNLQKIQEKMQEVFASLKNQDFLSRFVHKTSFLLQN
ncbi:MAG: YcjF family protein [Geminocystis sp.]|nr:YcjF family protein [Geminocystis sp.]MDW8464335.1 YcjF family protein [Geminocystis sp.]